MDDYTVKTKECIHCFKVKPLYEFNQLRTSYDGLNSRCRLCVHETKKLSEVEILRRTAPKYVGKWKM